MTTTSGTKLPSHRLAKRGDDGRGADALGDDDGEVLANGRKLTERPIRDDVLRDCGQAAEVDRPEGGAVELPGAADERMDLADEAERDIAAADVGAGSRVKERLIAGAELPLDAGHLEDR